MASAVVHLACSARHAATNSAQWAEGPDTEGTEGTCTETEGTKDAAAATMAAADAMASRAALAGGAIMGLDAGLV